MRRFRVIRGGLGSKQQDEGDPALTRRLRALYAPPGDGYWDGFEATIMAAVRAGRAAPAAAAGWCQTLARWARPGLAAAAVLLGVVGGVFVQTRGSRADQLYRAVLEGPAFTLEPLDEEFARASDPANDAASARGRDAVRAAADLLTDGVKRRPMSADLQAAMRAAADSTAALERDSAGARRGGSISRQTP